MSLKTCTYNAGAARAVEFVSDPTILPTLSKIKPLNVLRIRHLTF
jgi:hypothetical protein